MFAFRQTIRVVNQSSTLRKFDKSYLKPRNYFLVPLKASTLASMDTNVSKAPIAEQKAHKVVFGVVEGENRGNVPFKQQRYRDDPWFWLRDDTRESKEVLDYLTKENLYTEDQTIHLNSLKDLLYAEHISHLKETDEDPPHRHGKFFYYTRTVKGQSYKIHCRKKILDQESIPNAEEEIILDENLIAQGHKQCNIGEVVVSDDHNCLAYSVDYKGSETYAIKVLNLTTREEFGDQVDGTCGDVEWGADGKSFYYLTEDAAKRPYKAWKHIIGTPQDKDVLLFTEANDKFALAISKSKDGRLLFLSSRSKETSETSYINLHAGETEVSTIQQRQPGLKYSVQSLSNDKFVIWTNVDEAINNKLMIASIDKLSKDHWKEVMPYDSNRQIVWVEVFQNFVAIEGRQDGLTQVWIMDTDSESDLGVKPSTLKKLSWPDDLYECSIGVNKEFNTDILRIKYSSFTVPSIWQDYNMTNGNYATVKQTEVLNFDPTLYVSKRMMAKANDGTSIPISLVHKKDLDIKTGNTPTMLYGYGSYGASIDPAFHKYILPYLDRGMLFAIAHIRGGGEMGRHWYQLQGKYLNKRNTFSDFINCAEHLINTNVTNPSKLAIEGRSAGGLLIGAVLNMRPDLFKVAVAGVPFVDVMNTMSDPSIPLTTGEWEEWGNPNEAKYFDYMLSYSPYDNVREQPYPNILITCGLNDPRVAYWEPVKWASKLKTMKTDQNEVLVKIQMEAGHFSASDRYKYIKEKSFEQSVVLYHLGLVDKNSEKNKS